MSTNWGFACLSHDPPVLSDWFSTHTNDAYFQNAVALARRRPLMSNDFIALQGVDPYAVDDDFKNRNARAFLLEHPTCELGLHNEYGRHVSLNDVDEEGKLRDDTEASG